jgi:hypothetical protein
VSGHSFAIYKGAFTTSAERLAEKYIVAKVASAAGSNCHIDLQRDGNLGFYAQFLVQPLQPLAPAPNIPDYMSPPLMFWQSQTSNGGNDDYWLVLLDSGQLELHAGTPFADEGALYRSKLLEPIQELIESVESDVIPCRGGVIRKAACHVEA